ncbi:MAG: hypothetical protein QOI63_687 [Thermoplasmata archaeon]|nr:hypothetical protein [Thermoplasmata archaeon]
MRWLLAAALLLLPLAQGAQVEPGIHNPVASTPARLYFHLADARQDFAINAQAPPEEAAVAPANALADQSLSCLPEGTPVDGATQRHSTTYYGYSSPASVFYNGSVGQPAPERGLSFDVPLDGTVAPVLDWYVTASALPGGAAQVEPVLPNVVARATVRAGEPITVDRSGYESGTLLARGQTAPTTLAGAQTFSGAPGAHPEVTAEDQGGGKGFVYGFHIPLRLAGTHLTRAGFNVRVDLFMSLPTCDMATQDRYVMPSAVRPHSDPARRPGLRLNVLEPLRIDLLAPVFVDDVVVVHVLRESPWGDHDVLGGTLQLQVTGPDGAPVAGIYQAATVQRSHEHGRNYPTEPVPVTFVWPFREQAGKEGTYTVHLEATNLQGTATATAVTQFELGKQLWATRCGMDMRGNTVLDTRCVRELQDGKGGLLDPNQKSPGLQVVGVLATLALAALASRRQQGCP